MLWSAAAVGEAAAAAAAAVGGEVLQNAADGNSNPHGRVQSAIAT